jgi:hypothetical protein
MGMLAEELQLAGLVSGEELVKHQPTEQLGEYRHRQQEAGPARHQREPSSEMPPPGTIMCTCEWWVMVEPQVWSTAVMPILAPRRLGSAAMVSTVSAAALNSRS